MRFFHVQLILDYFSSSDQSEGVGSNSLPLPSGSIACCFSPICLKYFLSFLSGNPATAIKAIKPKWQQSEEAATASRFLSERRIILAPVPELFFPEI